MEDGRVVAMTVVASTPRSVHSSPTVRVCGDEESAQLAESPLSLSSAQCGIPVGIGNTGVLNAVYVESGPRNAMDSEYKIRQGMTQKHTAFLTREIDPMEPQGKYYLLDIILGCIHDNIIPGCGTRLWRATDDEREIWGRTDGGLRRKMQHWLSMSNGTKGAIKVTDTIN
jgi:hypothetical protein